jgi:hypothetical protein
VNLAALRQGRFSYAFPSAASSRNKAMANIDKLPVLVLGT